MSQIAVEWRDAFGDVAPVGCGCRQGMLERWLRVHSLPGSKRYPSGRAESDELLRRHNEVATAVLGADQPCLVFVGRLADGPGEPRNPTMAGAELDFLGLPELASRLDGGEWMQFAAARATWTPSRFDATIQAIAEADEAHVLFANTRRGTAYCPYDGGADLILANAEAVEVSRLRWSSWLSRYPKGL